MIHKSIADSALFQSMVSSSDTDTNSLRHISYIVSLYFGGYGFYNGCDFEYPIDYKVQYQYNARKVSFAWIQHQKRWWFDDVHMIRGDENLLHYNNDGLWRADVYIQSLNEYTSGFIGITADKYIYTKSLPLHSEYPPPFRTCIVYKQGLHDHRYKQQKECYVRSKINEQYELQKDESKKVKKTKKSKKRGTALNKLGSALAKKQIQLKQNIQFDPVAYLTEAAGQDRHDHPNLCTGKVLDAKDQWYDKIEPNNSDAFSHVSHFRKTVSRDFVQWNQHRFIETFETGDVVTVEVNVKEDWCRFYKNGVLQCHAQTLPKMDAVDKEAGLWLFLSACPGTSYVFDRKY